MSKKKLNIKPIKSIQRDRKEIPNDIVDSWVDKSITKTASNQRKQLELIEETRFTIVIPTYLHTRIKKFCASNSVSMKNAISETLLKAFPKT